MGITPKQTITTPAPPFPETIRYLWNWYQEIQPGIQGNGTTFPVITWEALAAWASLTRQEITPREAHALIMLGNIWAGIMAEKIENASKR